MCVCVCVFGNQFAPAPEGPCGLLSFIFVCVPSWVVTTSKLFAPAEKFCLYKTDLSTYYVCTCFVHAIDGYTRAICCRLLTVVPTSSSTGCVYLHLQLLAYSLELKKTKKLPGASCAGTRTICVAPAAAEQRMTGSQCHGRSVIVSSIKPPCMHIAPTSGR